MKKMGVCNFLIVSALTLISLDIDVKASDINYQNQPNTTYGSEIVLFDDHSNTTIDELEKMTREFSCVDNDVTDKTDYRESTNKNRISKSSGSATVTHMGKYKNIDWVIYDNGLLEVSGSGEYKTKNPNDGRVVCQPWYNYSDEIIMASVNIKGTTDFSEMFWKCHKLESVRFINTDTLYPETMEGMFADCLQLKNIYWGPIDTYHLKSMYAMFDYCKSIETFDLSMFDTSAVTDMGSMFIECYELKKVVLSEKFKTDKVRNMSHMFYGCKSLENIDLKGFNTGNVDNMNSMFSGCLNLEKLDLGINFTTSKVESMEYMFAFCKKIQTLNLANFDCSKIAVGKAEYMLYQCDSLSTIYSPHKTGNANIELYIKDQDKSLYMWVKRGERNSIKFIPSKLIQSAIYDKVFKFEYWDQFENNIDAFGAHGNVYYLSDDDYFRLYNSLAPNDILSVMGAFNSHYYHPNQNDTIVNKKWHGSCHGMATWVALQNNNWSSLGKSLNGAIADDDVVSKINYYHFQQYLFKNKLVTANFMKKASINKIRSLKEALYSGKVSLISYNYITPLNDDLEISKSFHSHTICGLAIRNVSKGEKTDNGINVSDYTYCVVVYDPKHKTISEHADYNIYFNDDGTYYIPDYGIRTTINPADNPGDFLVCVTTDIGYINGVDYYTGKTTSIDDTSVVNSFVRLSPGKKYSIKLNDEEIELDENGMIVGETSNIFILPDSYGENETSDTITVCLPLVNEYTVTASEGFEAYALGDYYTTYASISAGGEITFANNGDAHIKTNAISDKTIYIGMNDGVIENPWNYMYISSENGNTLSVSSLNDRFIVEGDNLSNSKVRLSNEFDAVVEPIVLPNYTTKSEFTKNGDTIEVVHNRSNDIDDNSNENQITECYNVEFEIIDSWNGGYNAVIRITNMEEVSIDNWTLSFDYDGEISNIWNAEIISHDDHKYIIKNVGWNQDITPKQTIEIGVSGQEDFVSEPTGYTLIGGLNEEIEDDYCINVQIYDDWGSGCNGTITITNNSNTTIEDWLLEFDYGGELINIWNANIVSHEGTHYIIKNAQYNSNILPGQSVNIGFNGGEGAGSIEPYGYMLYSYGQ